MPTEMGSYTVPGTISNVSPRDSYIQRLMMGGYAGNSYYTGADPAASVVAAALSDYGQNPTPDFAYYLSSFNRLAAASTEQIASTDTSETSLDKIRKALGLPTKEESAQAAKDIVASGGTTLGGLAGNISTTMIVIGIGAILILGAVLSFASDKGITIPAIAKGAV